MIVVLDTTVFGADALCLGNAWQALVLARSAWGIRISVTEVTLEEAIGNYNREVQSQREKFQDIADKRLGSLGLRGAFLEFDDVLAEAASTHEYDLRSKLGHAGVDILPVADIPHMDIVRRAVARRRPCNDKGDGFRDTLNWLTVLDLAKSEANEDIVWVSGNSRDFGGGVEGGKEDLHPDLQEDLESISALGRVSWVKTLPDLVLRLAENHLLNSEGGIEKVKESLRDDTVTRYIQADGRILSQLRPENVLDPEKCGLPREASEAAIESISGVREVKTSVKGAITGTCAVVEFTATFDAVIVAVLRRRYREAPAGDLRISKPLRARGLVMLDSFARPYGLEVADIEALPGDPDVVARRPGADFPPGYFDVVWPADGRGSGRSAIFDFDEDAIYLRNAYNAGYRAGMNADISVNQLEAGGAQEVESPSEERRMTDPE